MSKSKKAQSIIQIFLFIGIILFVNILGNAFYTYADLTEDQRFTLTKPTQKLLSELEDNITVNVLLEGEFPAGFKRLQTSTRELLDDFRSYSSNINYTFEDPSEGTIDEVNKRRETLREEGINPVNLRVYNSDEKSEKLIYPVAILHYGERQVTVNLLENEVPGTPKELILNNSVALLEYKFASAIQKLLKPKKPSIVFTTGHGELPPVQTADLEKSLRPYYNTGRINLDSVTQVSKEIGVLVVPKPRVAFSEKHKFLVDQYIMNGGKVLWMIDRLNVNLDSINANVNYIPNDYDTNLEDLLFKYGIRIDPNLVLDMQCTRIPLAVGQMGNQAQMDMFQWFYHPLVSPASNHPVVKSLDKVNFFFPSSIDTTVRTKTDIQKTVLLASSQYSRVQFSPVRLNFEILRYPPEPTKFNKGPQVLAALYEGVFPSLYENRVTQEMEDGLKRMGQKIKKESIETKMIVVSDGDVISNLFNPSNNSVMPLGFNKYEEVQFANKDFIINALEYLLDKNGVIQARSKEVKLRLLDTIRAKKEKTKWQMINLLLPLLFLAIFGFAFNFLRKKRFAS